MAISWNRIFTIVLFVILFFVALRFIWRMLRSFLNKNKKVLYARIKYNRFLLTVSGFSTVLLILVIIFLRHIPSAVESFTFIANLSRQNTPMNAFTAIATFFVTIHAGYKQNKEAIDKAKAANIPEFIIAKVSKERMGQSFKNGVILGLGAFLITNNIPSAFELSITVFEVVYFIYPYTIGLLIKKMEEPSKPALPILEKTS